MATAPGPAHPAASSATATKAAVRRANVLTGGWTVARRDISGARHVVASGKQLELAATPFMPVRTREEADAVRRFNEALRRDPRFPSRARIETDERVY